MSKFLETKELENIIDEKDLLIIDTRSFKEYSEGHIPNSVNLDLFSLHWLDSSKTGIDAFSSQMEKIFSFAGITYEKKIVFYDDISGMLAARGVWIMMYFSHTQTFMLDGGFKKWKLENRQIDKKINPFKPSKFKAKINPDVLVGFEYLEKNLKNLTIIDVRSKEEFNGTLIRAARGGHIPNAINIDWNVNIDTDGKMKNFKELNNLYDLPKDSTIVTYCQGAYRAANTFLALKKLGYQNVKVYLGSWGEWGNKLELPIS